MNILLKIMYTNLYLKNNLFKNMFKFILMYRKFKQQYSFFNRQQECKNILNKYPDRIPVICERSDLASSDCPYIDKKKYLVPRDLTVGQFLYVIRNRLKISQEKALYLFINGTIPTASYTMNYIYDVCKEGDGYLYVSYTFENTFG